MSAETPSPVPATLEVIVADSAGTCFGVEKAIDMALDKRKPILGPLVHNPLVVNDLASQGIRILERYRDLTPEDEISSVVITAHGYPKQLKAQLQDSGIEVNDATCPVLLRGVYRHIERYDEQGFHIFLVGNPNHAEIIASRSYGNNVTVVYTPEDAESVSDDLGKTVAMCQTTLTRAKFDAIVAVLQKKYPDMKVMDTRCRPVKNQQEAVEDLAKWVDGFIILGGYESSNTTNLARIARKYLGDKVWHVDRPEKITAEMLEGLTTLGIGGGTSTPKAQIDAARQRVAEVFDGRVLFRADKKRGGDVEVLPVDDDR